MTASLVQRRLSRNLLLFASIFLLIFSTSFISACNKNSSKNQAAEKDSESEQSPEAEGKKEALYGGNIVLGITQEPDYLDPHRAISAGTKELLFNVYEGLFKINPQGEFVPCLCSDYELSDDGLSLIVKISNETLFHDGSRLEIEDLNYSISRAAGHEDIAAINPALEDLELRIIDQQSLEIKLKEANPDLFSMLSLAIIKAGSGPNLDKNPCGTGPFKLSEYQKQNYLKLEKFADYHGKAAYLDSVKVQILADRDAAAIDLRSGQIDIFPYLGAEKITELSELYKIVSGSANMVQLWALNNAEPPLDDPELRAALNLAIDRKTVLELVVDGHGAPIYSGLSPALSEYFNQSIGGENAYNPEAAKALIQEKFPKGLSLSCRVPGNYIIHLDTAEVIRSQLAAVGVNLEIERVDWLTWLEEVYAKRNYQSTIIALTFDEFTARCALERYASDAPNNFINFKNKSYDSLLEKAIKTQDKNQRIEAYKELQKILYDSAASVFIQDPASLTAVRKHLAGYIQYPAYVQDLSLVYFTDEEALLESQNR